MITYEQYIEMQRRMKTAKLVEPQPCGQIEQREMALHDKIIAHCYCQFPRWKFIRARPDEPSSIQPGAQDFTVFLPNGRTLCIECKSSTGKQSEDQLIWAKEMQMLGHTVHVIRSFEQFLRLVDSP